MKPLNTQQGAVLLAITVLLLLAMSVFMLASYNQLKNQHQERLDTDYYARVEEARKALIAYALTKHQNEKKTQKPGEKSKYDRIRLGELPCPDASGDGSGNNIGNKCASLFGWLPWRTLGMTAPKDKRRIWYAVDKNFHNQGCRKINKKCMPEPVLNPSVQPDALTLDGQKMAAVLIAEGAPVKNQPKQTYARPKSSDKKQVSQVALMNQERQRFLEGSNARKDNEESFVSGAPSITFNDYAVGITSKTLMTWVGKMALQDMRRWFYDLADDHKYIPRPSLTVNGNCDAVIRKPFPRQFYLPDFPNWGKYGYIPVSCSPLYMWNNRPFEVFKRTDWENKNGVHDWWFKNKWYLFFSYTVGFTNVNSFIFESANRFRYDVLIKPFDHSGWDKDKIGFSDSDYKFYTGFRYKVSN